MGDYESDANSSNEWEDSWDSAWNEFNWEQYLQSESDQIKKYQSIYSKLMRSTNRLDEVALYMGWQLGSTTAEAEDPSEDLVPYTLHRHPLYVSSKALHGWLIEQLARRVSLAPEAIDASAALACQGALHESDCYGMLGVTALDVDDFALAIAYFKRGIASLNVTLGMLTAFESRQNEALSLYAKHARIRLFDIREIWLRVSSDCRETIARGSDES